jgi:hypothetical protein
LQAGWNWAAFSDFAADTDYFQLLTPPGTRPGGAGAFATNSGIKVLVAGVYRITAALLQSGASASGRYDTNLYILNGATGAVVATAESDLNNYVTGGSGYIRSKMSVELPLSVGNIVFPHNQALSAYGDAGGNWSNINLRYLGT